jgi:hypothetical protein
VWRAIAEPLAAFSFKAQNQCPLLMTPDAFLHLQYRTPGRRSTLVQDGLLAIFVIASHAIGIYALIFLMQPRLQRESETVQRMVIYLDAGPAQEKINSSVSEPVVDSPENHSTASVRASDQKITSSIKSKTPINKSTAVAEENKQASSKPMKLVDAYGRPRLPDDYIQQWEKQFGDQRVFDFQNPKLRDMDKLLERRVAIDYQPTQFDKAWRPENDLLTDILERAVEKTTKEVKIKIPGVADGKIVCKVSVLALGGGCGFVPNHGYEAYRDDPNTLNEEEAKQCAAWWEKIIHAETQSTWRRTKELYEAECQKPLEKRPVTSDLQSVPSR